VGLHTSLYRDTDEDCKVFPERLEFELRRFQRILMLIHFIQFVRKLWPALNFLSRNATRN
jgi:hypothetical protein